MLIAFGGIKRSGKDTAARYAAQRIGAEVRAFAKPMKDACEIIFDWPHHIWESEQLKEDVDLRWGISPRQALQHLGTEWAQYGITASYPHFLATTGKNLWVRRALDDYDDSKKLVISDLRFVHEAKAVHDLGGHLILVYGRGMTGDGHASETSVKDIQPDYYLDNSGDTDRLFDNIDAILNEIQGA